LETNAAVSDPVNPPAAAVPRHVARAAPARYLHHGPGHRRQVTADAAPRTGVGDGAIVVNSSRLADSTSDTPAGGGPCDPAPPPIRRRKNLLTPARVTPARAVTSPIMAQRGVVSAPQSARQNDVFYCYLRMVCAYTIRDPR
jgi:hypothetical protein